MVNSLGDFQKYYLESSDSKFIELTTELLDGLDYDDQHLSLRDFHADNLMILPARKGFNKIGVLDYQDASLGFLAYDLVSLLQDARRYIEEDKQEKYLEYFLANMVDIDRKKFLKEYWILGFQRNARIIGLFNKFAKVQGEGIIWGIWKMFSNILRGI